MKTSDGSVPPGDALKAARGGLKSAEASVASAKLEAKAARKDRKQAREVERVARRRLRRTKKELREAKRILAIAEAIRPRPIARPRLRRLESAKIETPAVPPPRTLRARKKSPRKRAIPALARNSSRSVTRIAPPVEARS